MSKIRIAFIHNKYIDYRTPFFELLSRRHDIVFFFEKENVPKETQIDSNFYRTFKFRSLRLSPMLPLKLLLKRFDLFISGGLGYTNSVLTLLLSKFLRKPFIIWTEEWHPEDILCKDRFMLQRKIAMHASACIAPGLKAASFLEYLGVRDGVTFIAPNASIPNADNSQKAREILPNTILKNGMIKVLYLGRVIPSKGIGYLIKAFSLLERKGLKATLIIAGQGPFLPELQALARKENNPNIIFTKKFTSDIDKSFLYQNCDIFVLPSVYYDGYVEAWGLVLNEAMAFGKPVIATEMVGAAHDLIENGTNGYLVPEKNVEALSEALMKIINDDQLKKSMGQRSKRIIEEGYKVSDMVNGFNDAIDFAFSNFESRR